MHSLRSIGFAVLTLSFMGGALATLQALRKSGNGDVVAISPRVIEYGSVTIGEEVSRPVMVTNNTDRVIRVSVDEQSCSCPGDREELVVEPGASIDLSVPISAGAAGTHESIAAISVVADARYTVAVVQKVTGIDPGEPTLASVDELTNGSASLRSER